MLGAPKAIGLAKVFIATALSLLLSLLLSGPLAAAAASCWIDDRLQYRLALDPGRKSAVASMSRATLIRRRHRRGEQDDDERESCRLRFEDRDDQNDDKTFQAL